MLAGKFTLPTPEPPEVAANLAVPPFGAVDERLTVVVEPFVVALPKVSSSVTVKACVAELLAWAKLSGAEVIASWVQPPP